MFLFKHMNELSKRPDSFNEKEFDKLFELANICNFTPEEYREYENSKKMSYDYYNGIDFAVEEKQLEIVRNLLAENIAVDVISRCTGVSQDVIMALKAKA